MESTVYDYAIIGAGAAGLHLALALSEDPFFRSKRLLILEKDPERNTYPTWCFWEKGKGKWDHIISKSWNKTIFTGQDGTSLNLDLGAYTYKMVNGKDFYREAQRKLKDSEQTTWTRGEVIEVIQGRPNRIKAKSGDEYMANHVFDSRIDPDFFEERGQYSYLKQHFEGWVIETKEEVFDQDVFTMMDYRLVYPGTTSFTYILPFSPDKALVEYTFFSPDLVEKDIYQHYLKWYIKDFLQVDDYKVISTESGVIPMTDYPFHQHNNEYLTKIGTAGGWVKGSTGYSFKNAERKSQKILDNLRNNKIPGSQMSENRFRAYDTLFLDVLYSHNERGPAIFRDMYQKNDIETIFSFLDEETSIRKEIKIMNTFDRWLFFKVALKHLLASNY
ncbi:MAG: hypothetical protein KI791_08395 [Cyclobacteriaceae bacterium]|nr:hypothetical protein [Cyclobacteriaceae bacterium SS2]